MFERVKPELEHDRPEDWDPLSEWCGWGCMICGRLLPESATGRPRKICSKAKCRVIYKRNHQRMMRAGRAPDE